MKKLILFFIGLMFVFCLPVNAEETIKIASIFSKSGEASEYTKEFYWGARVAVDLINEQGGVLGKKIELIELDNKSTAAGSIQAAKEAVRLGVTAVYGAAWSSHSIVMAPVLQKAGIPMISPASTNPKVTKIGDYIFRTCFTDSFQGKVMAYFALKDLKSKRAAVLTDVSSDFSMSLTEYFLEKYKTSESQIVYQGEYLKSNIDFKTLLAPLLVKQPDVIFLPGYISDSGFIIKQARKMGIKGTFLGTDGWGGARQLYDIAGDSIVGNYFTAPWHRDVSFKKGREYTIAYEKEIKDKIFPFAPMIYDVFLVLADAIERAGSLDRVKIRDEIAATREFEGASGMITFDKNGDPLNKDAVIMVFRKKEAVFYKSIRVEE
ncbi:MAG: ABC transporter substrate-binding protein [Desulfobacteraceae bacterium]|nr:ABC transporter substrate-binding protein [Desulfobacteraceae bacterium]